MIFYFKIMLNYFIKISNRQSSFQIYIYLYRYYADCINDNGKQVD